MKFKIGKNRIDYKENGKVLAEVDFPAVGLDVVCICHTYVDDALRGQGIADRLLDLAANELRKSNRKAVPKCSYAAKWFQLHPEYSDVLEK